MADGSHQQISFDPERITYSPYRTFRPHGPHPDDRHWREIRQQALDRDGHQCRCCGAQEDDIFPGYGKVRLEAHHRHYQRWGKELLDDVTVLCKECHRAITDRFMFWRDRARVINARGIDATRPEVLPAKAIKAAALPFVSTAEIGSLPTAAKRECRLPVHNHPS